MWSRLWRFLTPFHRSFFVFTLLMTVYSLFEVVGSYMPSLVVQLNGNGTEPLVWALVILGKYVFDDVYMRLDNAVNWHIVIKHSVSISMFVKTSILERLVGMDVAWHQTRKSGVLLGRLGYGAEKLDELVGSLSWEFVPRTTQAIVSFVPLVFFSPVAALVAFAATIVFLRLTILSNSERKEIRSNRFNLYDEFGHREVELIQNIATVVEYRQRTRLMEEYRQVHKAQFELAKRDFWISNYKFNRLRIWVINLAKLIIVPIWVVQLSLGLLSVPSLIFVWALTDKLFDSCWRYAGLLDRVFDASEPISRVIAFQDERPLLERTGVVRVAPQPLSITMKNVCFSYGREYDPGDGTIHDLSFDLPVGKSLAVVGTSGAGKSTLYQLVMAMRYSQSGDVLVGGVSVRDWDHDSLLSLIAHMASGDRISIFDDTIERNISFGNPEATLPEVSRAAELAGLSQFIDSLPLGYSTQVGERGILLSAGQKQRLAFARALIVGAPILLLDEPTSAVDAETEKVMQEAIQSLSGKRTMMICAHRLATIMHADNIIVLSGGRKTEEGTHDQLVALGGKYARMWSMQIGQEES